MAKATTTKVAKQLMALKRPSASSKRPRKAASSAGAARISQPASGSGEDAASKLPSCAVTASHQDCPEGSDSAATRPLTAQAGTSKFSQTVAVPSEGSLVPNAPCSTTAGRTAMSGAAVADVASRAAHGHAGTLPASATAASAERPNTDQSIQRAPVVGLQPAPSAQTPNRPIGEAQIAENPRAPPPATVIFRCIGVTLADAARHGLPHIAPNVRVAVDMRGELHFGGCGQVFANCLSLNEHLLDPSVSCIGYFTGIDGMEVRRCVITRALAAAVWSRKTASTAVEGSTGAETSPATNE